MAKPKLSECSCVLCGWSNLQAKQNHPPQMQYAHVIANRFSGREKRYKGVRNAFGDAEWKTLIEKLGNEFNQDMSEGIEASKKSISKLSFPMCAECHEEVLSEPLYLPSFLRDLYPHFVGKKRIEKMLILADVLKLGLDEFKNRKTSNRKHR